jgi:tRNA pseudouridine38-40 synthase
MYSYKLIVAYDGTGYHGWQWQDDCISIDQVIRKTFLRVFRQKTMHIVGASRTDAGVHAQGQVVRIGTELALDPEKLKEALNRALPSDIVIKDCCLAQENFHPQHMITKKTYVYRFFLKRPLPIVQRYGTFISYKIDTHKLAHALATFVGTYDFRSFSKELPDKNTIRTITSIELMPCDQTGGYKIIVVGKSFLRHMIRRIVGAAFEVARQPKRSVNELKQLLLAQSQSIKNLPTAPAKGLCLESIVYYPCSVKEDK